VAQSNGTTIIVFPEMGFDFYCINLGNPKQLGYLYLLGRYIDFNMFQKGIFDVDFRSSLGASYVNKTFHPTENYRNVFFSKHVNFYFGFNLNTEVLVWPQKNVYLHAGAALLHASNGETKMPNGGISAMSYTLGFSMKTGQKPQGISRPENDEKLKKIKISLSPSFGVKEDWRWGSDKFIQFAMASDFLYRLNRKQWLGLGASIFYDESLMSYSNHNIEPVRTRKEATSGGFHFAHHFDLSPLFLVLNVGIVTWEHSGRVFWAYKQIGVKYNFLPKFFATLYHKSIGAFYGENILWGVGYEF
jgi:hypothetical protein